MTELIDAADAMKDEYDFSHARRGAVKPVPPGKTLVRLHLDDQVLDWFRAVVHAAGGGDIEVYMNEALRKHIARQETELKSREATLEDLLRRIVREEVHQQLELEKEAQQK